MAIDCVQDWDIGMGKVLVDAIFGLSLLGNTTPWSPMLYFDCST